LNGEYSIYEEAGDEGTCSWWTRRFLSLCIWWISLSVL